MKAIVYSERGDSSVLRLVDREQGRAGAGEIVVKVMVSGVNPTDWKSRAAIGREMPFAEIVPNQDGAGIVTEVGEGVTEHQVGDRVWLYLSQYERPTGTAQEYTVLPADRAVRLPDHVGFDAGANIGVPAMTAHRALTVHEYGPARLSPGALDGRVVLVQGGAGAVGNSAIQLAVWAGATVIATVSSDAKAELATAAGAHHVLQYPDSRLAEQILAIAPGGVDHIIEVSPIENTSLDIAVAASHACISYYANNHGDEFTIPIVASFSKNLRWQGLLLYTLDRRFLTEAAEDITDALIDGAWRAGPDAGLPFTWFPLAETAAAHDAVEGGATGKVLISVHPD